MREVWSGAAARAKHLGGANLDERTRDAPVSVGADVQHRGVTTTEAKPGGTLTPALITSPTPATSGAAGWRGSTGIYVGSRVIAQRVEQPSNQPALPPREAAQ